MIVMFDLVVFMPTETIKAIEKQQIETLECDLVNFNVNVEITQTVNLIASYKEVAISGGELLKYNDNYAFNDGSGELNETEWYCSNNYVLYSIGANFIENQTTADYNTDENQIEGWEVSGGLHRYKPNYNYII